MSKQRKVGDLLEALPGNSSWTRLSAGAGSQGPREYDWIYLPVNPGLFEGWQRGLLVRRSLDTGQEMAAYFTFAPCGTSLKDLALAAGARWNIEPCFQESKSQLRLDQYEVQTWRGWYRHITLVMASYALLRRQLKKSLLLSLGGQGRSFSLWPKCGDGCASPPLPSDEDGWKMRCTGPVGEGFINVSPSTITG